MRDTPTAYQLVPSGEEEGMQAIAKPTLDAAEQATQAQFTMAASVEPLTKRYHINADGKLVITPGGQLRRGTARVAWAESLGGLKAHLMTVTGNGELQPRTAFIYGVPVDGRLEATLVARAMYEDLDDRSGVIARTKEHFDYPPGPAIMMLDRDRQPDEPEPPADDRGEALIDVLACAVPAFGLVPLLWWPSASSCIWNEKTDEQLTGIRGERIWIMVKDGRDIPRAGKVLVKRLWLAGHGRIVIGGAGQMLERTLVDGAVWSPERFDFVAGADCAPPLVQRRGEPQIYDLEDDEHFVDTREVFLDLTDEEEREYARLVAEAKAAAKPEAKRAEDESVERQAKEKAGPDPRPEALDRAREAVRRARDRGELPPDFTVYVVEKGRARPFTVAEIVADPDRFGGAITLDPLEPDYRGEKAVGKLFVSSTGVRLHSMAHGGATYLLEGSQPADIGEMVSKLADKMVKKLGAEAFVRLQNQQKAPDELTLLLNRKTWALDLGIATREESWDAMAKLVRNLQHRYVHYPSGSVNEEVVDTFTGTGYRRKAFTTMMAQHAMELPTGEVYTTPKERAGQPKMARFNPVDLMLEHKTMCADTMAIAGYQFEPGNTARLLETPNGEWKVNIYAPPQFLDGPSTPAEEWFEVFLEYLVPGEEERDWLVNWIAHKVQHSAERGVGVVLVTKAFGSGRNVLMKIMRELLGAKWCSDVPAGVLLGTSGQAQFDDTLLNKALITCDEIAQQGWSFDARMKAYERLKSVIDPWPQARSLNRKSLSMVDCMVYYSALLASNHETSALPLPPGDRRFAVIACTRQPMKTPDGIVTRPDIKAIIDEVLPPGKPPNAAAIKGLWEYLTSLETRRDRFQNVPMTDARATMVEDSEGEVEETIRRYLGQLPAEQDVFWFDNLVQRGEQWLEHDKRMAVRDGFKRNARKLLRHGFAGWEYPNAVTNFAGLDEVKQSRKGVVRREGTLTSSLRERGHWLASTEVNRNDREAG